MTAFDPTTRFLRGPRAWLPQSLKFLKANHNNIKERYHLHWSLIVGRDIAAVSRVERVTPKTLYVTVAGKEWFAAIKPLERKILKEINAISPSVELKRMVLKEGLLPAPASSPPGATRVRAGAPLPPEDLEGTLDMIQDETLKSILTRLGNKITLLPVLLIGCLGLANCATVETSALPVEPSRISLDRSLAIKEIQKLNQEDPQGNYKDPRAYFHYLMALKFDREKNYRAAAAHLAEVVRYDPQTERFYSRLSNLYLRNGQFDKGIELCKQGLERFPENLVLEMNLADMLAAEDKKSEALEYYLKITDQDPARGRAFLLAGVIHQQLKEYREARRMFEDTIVVAATNPLGYYYLSTLLIRDGHYEEARKNLAKSLDLRPNFLSAREHLAYVLEKQKKFNEAIEEYRIILKLNPGNKRIRQYLARTYHPKSREEGGPPAEGEEALDPLLEDSSIHMKLGSIYYEQASYLAALDEFRLVTAAEEKAVAGLIISKIYELLGRLDEAISEMSKVLQYEPGSVDIQLQIARLYTMNDQTEKAIEAISRSIQLEPKNDRLYHSLALAYMSEGKNNEAVQYVARAIELNPKNDAYYFELGALLERVGNIQGAIENMKKTIELNPMHSNAHNFLGYIYASEGVHLNKALDHLKKALAVQPRNGYFLDSLGWVYFKKGEFKKALQQMKKALVYTPPDPVLYDHLGDIYFQLKNYTEARKAWTSSRSLTLMRKDEPDAELPDEKALEQKLDKVKQMLDKSL